MMMMIIITTMIIIMILGMVAKSLTKKTEKIEI